MLIFSELILTVYFNHFELENGVMTTPKRRSTLSFILTCLCITIPLLIYISQDRDMKNLIRDVFLFGRVLPCA